jgi:hypothetical protein
VLFATSALWRHVQDVKSLEAQLDAQQDIAAQLSAELEEKAAELAEVRGGGVLAAAGWAVLGIQCTVLKLVSCRLNC